LEAIKALARWFSYLFHGLLTLFLVVACSLALASGIRELQVQMLPWAGRTLIWVLLGGSLWGFFTLCLAVRGKLRGLFFLWCLAVAGLLLKGYIFSGYRFAPGEARWAFGLIGASLISVAGAWFQMLRRLDDRWRLR